MKLRERIKKIITDHHFEDSLLFVSVGLLCAVICSVYAILFGKIEHLSVSVFKDLYEETVETIKKANAG